MFVMAKTSALSMSSESCFESCSPHEVCVFLKEQVPSIPENILEKMKEHKIDGEAFLALNEEYLREISPLIGDRLKIKRP